MNDDINRLLAVDNSMPHNFYLWVNGSQHGPYVMPQLLEMWKTGQVTADTLAWREGLTSWVPISTLTSSSQSTSLSQTSQLQTGSGLVVSGMLCAFASLIIFPPAFGIASLICGIVVLVKGRIGAGVGIILMAGICATVGMIIGAISMTR